VATKIIVDMKILFVIDTLGSGGKERRLTELLKALTSRKEIAFELTVMSNDIHYNEIWDLGIKVHQIIRKSRRDVSVFRKFHVLIKQVNPDVVHCWDSMTTVYLAPVCKVAGCALINGMVTNVPLKNKIFNYHWIRARITFPLSSVIVSNSLAGLKAYNVPKRKGIVVSNGFNFTRVRKLREAGGLRDELEITTDFVVGMVASFGLQKDYPTYYKAAHLILASRRDITFIAIGAYTDSEESLSLIDTDLRQHFRLMGKRNDIESCINIMDVCVLATFTEGISNSVMEYMALSKPVVASIGGGTEEIVKSGITGFLVKPSDYEALAVKINELLDDEEKRRAMGNKGKELIKSCFSIEQMVTSYLSLYTKISANRQ